ncbi:MAG: hypothetical protein ACLGI8_07880 [Acidimicrobiia bacterium]
MTITSADIARTVRIVDRSGAADKLAAALRTDNRGRKEPLQTHAFLVGSLLAVEHRGTCVIKAVHELLLSLPRDWQWRLGVLTKGPTGVKTLPLKHFYYLSARISEKLEYGTGSMPDLSDAEREDRRRALFDIIDSLLDVTLIDTTTGSYAIDGSGIWSWAKGKKKAGADEATSAGDAPDQPSPAPFDGDNVETEQTSDSDNEEPTTSSTTQSFDPDAGWGVKTAKKGGTEVFFGYQLNALVRVPGVRDTKDQEPRLVERFALTPAHLDIVDASLDVIDRIRERGAPFSELLSDRHYSYKTPERWADELAARGIRQVLDLHANDQGFRDYNGARLAAGWLHCPATPDDLGTISHPGPDATKDELDAFRARIARRQQYAFRRVAGPQADGSARWECPAINGTLGCPLREGTEEVAVQIGLPVVRNAPDAATAPKCCTQRTVSTGSDAQRKIVQELYWGSDAWIASYKRRTYIEGVFGNIKNPDTENVRRGYHRIRGIARVSLFMAFALVSYNQRMLRNWHDRTGLGDPEHPVLVPDPQSYGHLELTAEQAAALDELLGDAA